MDPRPPDTPLREGDGSPEDPAKRLAEVLEHSRDILYRRDLRTGRYTYVSRAFGRILGYTPEETDRMVYEGVERLIHPEDRSRHRAVLGQLAATTGDDGGEHLIEYRMQCRDGTYRWFSDRIAIARDEGGRPLFVVGSNRDITVEKQAQGALSQAHERLRSILDAIDAHVYVADFSTYEIRFMNRRMKDAFGDDLEGRKCYEVFRNEPGPCPHCANPRLVDAGGRPAGVHVWEGLNPLTGRWYTNHDRAIHWVDGRLARLQIATDITRQKQLEAERERTEARLRQAQKLEAVGTLAGGIAHDFNNLFTAMLGTVSLMLIDTDAGDPRTGSLETLEKQIRSATRLTHQLLGYARKGRYEVRPMAFNPMLREIVEAFGRTRKDIRIHLDLEEPLPDIPADEGQVEQVIWNLLVNASEAMPDGGALEVTTRSVRHEAMEGRRFRPAAGTYIHLTVTDDGVGIPPEAMDRVFEPFFTTKEMGRGTGLGLAAVYGILKGHGGYIDVMSAPGRGTTFEVFLPAGGTRARDCQLREPREASAGGGVVLLVDDEAAVRSVGAMMLGRLGYQVLHAGSGEEALEIYRSRCGEVDLVILDLVMPGMGGGEVFDRLKAVDPGVRVLLSSGYSEDGKAREILDRGCMGFLQKPFGVGELGDKVEAVLGSGAAER